MVQGHGPTLLEKIASGAGSVAKLATAVAPIISMINTEQKYQDKTAAVTAFNPGTSDNLICLTNNLAQGTNDYQRIGNSVLAKDLQFRGAINFTATTGTPNITGIHCRLTMFCWKEDATINPPSAAKLFESPTNLYSCFNKNYTPAFVVMKDKFFSLNNSNGLPGASDFRTLKIFKKLDWHLHWFDGGVNDITQNHVYVILRSSATTSSNALAMTYYSRVNFTDN